MIRRLYLLIVLIGLPFISFAQDKWQLIKDEDGIKVYGRKLEGKKFKEIKADFELNATEDQLIAVIKNISHQKDWSYGTKESYIINTVKKYKDTLIYYVEVALPWPMTNRDLTIELSFKKDTINKALHIQAKSVSGILPVNPKLVRVPYSLASWDVRTQSNKTLKITYTLSTNPGGSLPAWLVNFAASTGPFNSFHKLREVVNKKNI